MTLSNLPSILITATRAKITNAYHSGREIIVPTFYDLSHPLHFIELGLSGFNLHIDNEKRVVWANR